MVISPRKHPYVRAVVTGITVDNVWGRLRSKCENRTRRSSTELVPELMLKAQEGRLEDIRHCVACNQGCLGRLAQGRPVTCIQNAAAGREKRLGLGTMKPASVKKKVMIIGGGPAGMEAARVAAMRGHEVTLYEKTEELGGQVKLAAKAPNRDEWGEIARNLIRQIERAGVKVKLGIEVMPDLVIEQDPDAVVVATGSTPLHTGFSELRPDLPCISGADQDNVITVWDVLQGQVKLGEKIVLIDNDYHQQAACAAEAIVEQGKKLEIITRLMASAVDLQLTLESGFLYRRLLAKGAIFTPNTAVKQISGKTVVAYNIYSSEERRIGGVDTVVLAMGNKADNGLYKALKGRVRELHSIGDCVSPQSVANAIWEGHQVGRAL